MHRNDQFPGKGYFITGGDSVQDAGQPATIEMGKGSQQTFDIRNRVFRQINARRFHFHHPAPRDISRQRKQMIHVRMGYEPLRSSHETPRLGPEIETELQLRETPKRLHGRAGISFDGQSVMNDLTIRNIGRHEKLVRMTDLESGIVRHGSPTGETGRPRFGPATDRADQSTPTTGVSQARSQARQAGCSKRLLRVWAK